MKKLLKNITLMMTLAALSLSAACTGKLTSEDYDKVTIGMTKMQVDEILGKPAKIEIETGSAHASKTTYTYIKGQNRVEIVFYNDNVINKKGSFK